MHPHTLEEKFMAVDKLVLYTENSVAQIFKLELHTRHSLLKQFMHYITATCPYQMWHCSRSLSPDGLDCADHINLSFCLHLLNQRPNGYECTSATETVTASGKGYHVRNNIVLCRLLGNTNPQWNCFLDVWQTPVAFINNSGEGCQNI